MLSEITFEFLDFAFKSMSIFCVLPYDWDSKARTLKYSKYGLRVFLNRLTVFGVMIVLTYIAIRLFIDYKMNKIPPAYLGINSLMLAGAFAFCTMGISFSIFGKECAQLLNALFATDDFYAEQFLSTLDVKNYNKLPTTPLVVKAYRMIAPFSIIHSLGMCLLFFEEYDMFRLYVFSLFEKYFGFNTIWHEGAFLVIYAVAIRYIYGYLLLTVFAAGMYAQCTQCWLEFLKDPKIACKMTKEEFIGFYQQQQLMNQVFNNCMAVQIITAVSFGGMFVTWVLVNYCSIKLIGKVNFFAYIVNPLASVVIFVTFKYWFAEAGKLKASSGELLDFWKEKVNATDKEFQIKLETFRPLHHSVNNFFKLEGSTFATFLDQCTDKTITLILG